MPQPYGDHDWNTMTKKKDAKLKDDEIIEVEQAPLEVMSVDVDARPVEPEIYAAETAVALLNDALEEKYHKEIRGHTGSSEISTSLTERQQLNPNNQLLQKKLAKHNSESPMLSGGDLDAKWGQANDAGSETVGGTAPTPGQNDIDAMGEAVGLLLAPDEPLNLSEQRRLKDGKRAELTPPKKGESDD